MFLIILEGLQKRAQWLRDRLHHHSAQDKVSQKKTAGHQAALSGIKVKI